MKKIFAVTAAFFLLGLSANAQSKEIPFVDIAASKVKVETLTKENDTLKSESETLRKQNDDLRSQIASNQKQINDITPILENVKNKGIELAAILSNISDKTMRGDAEKALARNKDLEKRLIAKIDELEKSNLNSQKTITNNQKNIDINDSKVQKNKDDIILLEAAIAKTEVQQGKLSSYMKDVDTFLNNAESVLKTTETK